MIRSVIRHFVEDRLRNISGPIGIRLRRRYYSRRFRTAGRRLVIDIGVIFQRPEYISAGDNVWIDRNCIFIAGPAAGVSGVKRPGEFPGHIHIGSGSHIGIGTIIQGHEGVWMGDCFTSSPGCKIYSLSNDFRNCRNGTTESGGDRSPAYVGSAVMFGRNVWLGLNVSVVAASLGDDVFIMPNSVVSKPVASNSVAAGAPATRIGARFPE